MTYHATVVNVMIASPSDVAKERRNIRDVIHEWNAIHSADQQIVLMPLGWETHASPKMGDSAQNIINKQVLDRCDLLIAVFWTRLGSPTGESPSGTVEEIERHLAASKPAMIYFSNAPVHPESVDDEQYAALRAFKEDCKRRGLIETYDEIGEFRDKFARHLAQTVLREFCASASDGFSVPEDASDAVPALSTEANEMLIQVSEDHNGKLLRARTMGGTTFQTNGRELAKRGEPRSEAMWEAALQELLEGGFLEERGSRGEIFRITNRGYALAARLKQP